MKDKKKVLPVKEKKIIPANEKKKKTAIKPEVIGRKIFSPRSFPIVGIGASAGGLEAMNQFFGCMPENTGMAFVVIQHLDPTHEGILPELLQRITPMRVFQASDRLKVKPDTVYVIPPNKSLSLLNGVLHLFDPVEIRGLRLPVDYFFRSLADDQQQRSIGVILSGMGSDGSLGLKAIKERNGIVLVQDPDTAKFDGMPRSAIGSVVADIVAPADKLPAKLIAYLKLSPEMKIEPELDSKNKSNIEKIIILLRQKSGHDFSQYKKNTLVRRIERRKVIHQIDKISNYVRFLQNNPHEVDILFKELLIGVTSFFRDTDVWKILKERVLPDLFNELKDGHVLRVWIPACSTGEEAYSLAIVFKEALEKTKKNKKLAMQIFATDLDIDAIERARKGFYAPNIAADVSPERLSRFFTLEADGYRVNAAIREMVVFAPQNVIKDPPFTKLDILVCRNMLIYMESDLQKKLISLFGYSLNPGGIMLLGNAETLGAGTEGFVEIDSKLKIFKRSAEMKAPELDNFPSAFYGSKTSLSEKNVSPKPVENIQVLADQVMLQRYAPASVMVNDKGDILYITGRTGKYLEPSAGKANWNIHAMARDGLREVLPGAFRKAMKNFDPVHENNIKIGTNGDIRFVDVIIQRMDTANAIRDMIMVVFIDIPAVIKPQSFDAKTGKQGSTNRHKELEIELQRSYDELQSTKEEMQTSQEELKSTNEELQSTNEELQSTNEELTTSKEEMQSLNEELQTVNVELQIKISDYVQANNDMKNLLNSTEIATLFLDKELNIRRFTDQVAKIIKLRETDIGRPFTDLVTDLQYPDIETHAKEVLKTLTSIETVISTYGGSWFNVRIMPYRTSDDRIDGIVMTFADVTAARLAEMALRISETRFRSLFEFSMEGILLIDAKTGKIIEMNPRLTELLGCSPVQITGKPVWELNFFKNIASNQEKFLEYIQKNSYYSDNLSVVTFDGRKISIVFNSNVYTVENVDVVQCLIHAVTDRYLTEK